MKSTGEAMTIGEVARRFGLAAHVLRHWESIGLLAPARVVAGRRRYGPDDLYRVAVILRAKEAGFGLATSATWSPRRIRCGGAASCAGIARSWPRASPGRRRRWR